MPLPTSATAEYTYFTHAQLPKYTQLYCLSRTALTIQKAPLGLGTKWPHVSDHMCHGPAGETQTHGKFVGIGPVVWFVEMLLIFGNWTKICFEIKVRW